MSAVPLVSVMMPAYNAGRFIARAIRSVLEQTCTDWELVIVDDGSTDDTGAVAAAFRDRRVKRVRQANAGEAAARNTALSHVRGKWLAFLDADDAYLPHHIETAVRFLERHPGCDAVYTDGYYCDAGDTRLEKLSARRIAPVQGRIYEHLVRTSSVFGPPLCVVLRRDLVERRRLRFDPEIVIGPDWDFFVRFSECAEFGCETSATCLYRVHGDSITVRAGAGRRSADLARCRTKAIRMESFRSCSVETRSFVFYDLLIHLLADSPQRQAEVLRWPQFEELPRRERARLLRLVAASMLRSGRVAPEVAGWLDLSRTLHRADVKGALIAFAYRLSPRLCGALLRAKDVLLRGPDGLPPRRHAGAVDPAAAGTGAQP